MKRRADDSTHPPARLAKWKIAVLTLAAAFLIGGIVLVLFFDGDGHTDISIGRVFSKLAALALIGIAFLGARAMASGWSK